MSQGFPTTFVQDAPVVQDASYRFSPAERQRVDAQILGLQAVLQAALVSGVVCTYFFLDASSAACALGDVLCSSSNPPVSGIPTTTRALSAPLNNSKLAAGIALAAGAPGGRVLCALAGLLPSTITGLSAGPGYARVNGAAARAQNVASFGGSDVALGAVDGAGTLSLNLLANTAAAAGYSANPTWQLGTDANYPIALPNVNEQKVVVPALTAARTWILPAAADGQQVTIYDLGGNLVDSGSTLSLQANNGTDHIFFWNGATGDRGATWQIPAALFKGGSVTLTRRGSVPSWNVA